MNPIEREPTQDEAKDFKNISDVKGDIARVKFYAELTKNQQEALKLRLPFAYKVAVDDFNDYYKRQAELSMRKNGGFVNPLDIKPIKLDWSKYSDLKNFEQIDEGEIADGNLSKHNPGLDVKMKHKTYKFKGYSEVYIVMEDGPSAIVRARKNLKELEDETKGRHSIQSGARLS